jgi:hypothetical protein
MTIVSNTTSSAVDTNGRLLANLDDVEALVVDVTVIHMGALKR